MVRSMFSRVLIKNLRDTIQKQHNTRTRRTDTAEDDGKTQFLRFAITIYEITNKYYFMINYSFKNEETPRQTILVIYIA